MVGTQITIQKYDLEGNMKLEWPATIEHKTDESVIVRTQRGTLCGGYKGGWEFHSDGRAHFWPKFCFNLCEFYSSNGIVDKIVVDISGQMRFQGSILSYTDYERDIIHRLRDFPRLTDLDEFHDVVRRLNLPASFQSECYKSVADAFTMLSKWKWSDRKSA